MIENQSDNIDNKETDDSNQDNVPEDISSTQNLTTENNELSSQKTEDINTEELKNTISNNDARLEQLEIEQETLKNQYVRISADPITFISWRMIFSIFFSILKPIGRKLY